MADQIQLPRMAAPNTPPARRAAGEEARRSPQRISLDRPLEQREESRADLRSGGEESGGGNPLVARLRALIGRVPMRVWIIIGSVIVLIFFGVMIVRSLTSGEGPRSVGSPQAAPAIPALTFPTPAPEPSWDPSAIRGIKPQEQAVLRVGVVSPKDIVLFVLGVLAITLTIAQIVVDWRESHDRGGGDRPWEKALIAGQSACGLFVGLLSVPLIALSARDGVTFFVVSLILFGAWCIAAIRIVKDGTPWNVGLVLFATSLAIRGVTELPVGLANIGDGGGRPWVGFFSPYGLIVLLSQLKFEGAALTMLVYILLFGALTISVIEALRHYHALESLVAAGLVFLSLALGNLFGVWVVGLIDQSTPEKAMAVLYLQPTISWLVGVAFSLILVAFLQGRELTLRNVTMKVAQVSGAQANINFVMLVTTISIALNLLGRG